MFLPFGLLVGGAVLMGPSHAVPVALDSTGTIVVLVTDSVGHSIGGASIRIDGIAIAPTDDFGSSTISVRADRRHLVQVRAFGYAPAEFSANMAAGQTKVAEVPLGSIAASIAAQLPGVRVTVHQTDARRSDPGLAGFAHRRETLGGTFINAEQIRERGSPPLSLLLRGAPGVAVMSSVVNGMTESRLSMRGAPSVSGCPIQLYVDGHSTPLPPGDLNIDHIISTRELAAIEVYPSSAWVPAQFMGPTSGCGTLVLWTVDALTR
ncbi:MAG: TonB-dependent receptor plug domain-containing protein [Gemmatimonadaceae bacterium]